MNLPVIIIGAGIGGLAAAVSLAARGEPVLLLERASAPGGKMRHLVIGDARIDAGPTVFTMRWVFDELFQEAGARLEDHLRLESVDILARHAWVQGGRLDLFADVTRSAEAIAQFAGLADAQGYRDFVARARRTYQALEEPFIRSARPTPVSLVARAGFGGAARLLATQPFASLWTALGEHFRDPRLRQLFGRYATYVGSSPFLAPATLMLIAHVEQSGVWLVEGGMHQVARTLAGLAEGLGARLRYQADVAEVLVESGRAVGVRLQDGEKLGARAVIVNADASALTTGRFGAVAARALSATPRSRRSLSAVTWAMHVPTKGFPLVRHNVFFSRDYAEEFAELTKQMRLPAEPTVYVCAQDRGDDDGPLADAERLLVLVNAPARGDFRPFEPAALAAVEAACFAVLERCGLHVIRDPAREIRTTPLEFEALFPATGGALYGQAVHGWQATFNRPGSRTKIPGLYVAGGSVHPGAGVPMATLSGRLAAAAVLEAR